MKVFITGINGFIGSWITARILNTTSWEVVGIDIRQNNLEDPKNNLLGHERLTFKCADMTQEWDWMDQQIQEADVVLPLAAIANPALYVKDPLRVFHLDFEVNLEIVKRCVAHKTRIVFPSTSEVYGMCGDAAFDEEFSNLTLGPTQKSRWIYSCSKQMLDRVIHAYGEHQGLPYTLFRPFNFMGPRLDDVHAVQEGSSRAISQFIGNAIYGRPIHLVGGGAQRRAFVYIEDALDALMLILENKNNVADQQIFNIGNPDNDHSIKEIAGMILNTVKAFPADVQKADQCELTVSDPAHYFGESYQDVDRRVPSIKRAEDILGWRPKTTLQEALDKTVAYYLA